MSLDVFKVDKLSNGVGFLDFPFLLVHIVAFALRIEMNL